ncbi:MAG: OmpA family protein [Burkholderiaceae bacterium]|nr:OmpA family protein [Burkholderiaceae bacterium]
MSKLSKLALVLSAITVSAAANAGIVSNWVAADGTPWRAASGECWRSGFWTPATAAPGCDGAIAPVVAAKVEEKKAAPAPEPGPVVEYEAATPTFDLAPAPAPAPKAAVAPVAAPAKITYAADAFFAFDKSVVQPAGKAKLDDLVKRMQAMDIEVVVAVGHTDSTGPSSYNQRLSVRRAEAVKAYMVSKGVDADRIFTEGKGEDSPVADNSSRSGRAKNRRVEVEVVGTAK